MTRLVVVGGGVSGLATAHFARRAREDLEVTVLEAEARLGGNVQTLSLGGIQVEAGPDALVTSRVEVRRLLTELGLEDELTRPSPAAGRVLIASRGALEALPEGLVFGIPTRLTELATTPLLSWRGKARALLDLVLPRAAHPGESVGALIDRRLGREVKDRLVEPLIGGIYAADIDRMDPRVGLPMAASAEGSLVHAMARARRGGAAELRAPRGGMSRLVSALEERLTEAVVRRETTAHRVERHEERWRVTTTKGESIDGDAVVLAVPPSAASPLVTGLDEELAQALARLVSASSAAVLLSFAPGTSLPSSSGVLIPRVEGRATRAATFVNAKWGRASPTGELVVRAIVGGARTPELLARADDAELIAIALEDLRAYLPLPEPVEAKVVRFRAGSPQAEVGHAERVREVRELAARHGRLALVSAAYEGPGLAGCIAQAARVASALFDA